METWKNIRGFEDYMVSSKGRIRNRHGRILKTHYTSGNGSEYLGDGIKLRRDQRPHRKLVKRLVADAFIGNTDGKNVLFKDPELGPNVDNLVILSKTRNPR